jgi:hypothetical protein
VNIRAHTSERIKGPLQGEAAAGKSPVSPLVEELFKQITVRAPNNTNIQFQFHVCIEAWPSVGGQSF